MSQIAGLSSFHVDVTKLSVQQRIDGLVSEFKAKGDARGFTAAWAKALDPKTVGAESWESYNGVVDYSHNSTFSIPPDVRELAKADATAIASQISKEQVRAPGARTKLVAELETACAVGGLKFEDFAPLALRDGKRLQGNAAAAEHYVNLDSAAEKWASAIGKSPKHVGWFQLNAMSSLHHARLTSANATLFDVKASAVIEGAAASQAQKAAERAAAIEARKISPDNALGVVSAFVSGTKSTVHGLTAEHMRSIMMILETFAGDGDHSLVSDFMTHFREHANHGTDVFASDEVRSDFFRGKYETHVKGAFEKQGLDYSDYNGIFDMDRFNEKVDARAKA